VVRGASSAECSAVVGQRQDNVGCEGSEREKGGDPRRRGSWLQPRKKERGKINLSVSFS
jgi:hypothetical protein